MRDYLDAAEPHDLVLFTAADVAGAVVALLQLRDGRARGDHVVRVGNPTADTDGWESPHTVVEIATDDLPFILDSVTNAIVRRGYDIHLLFHPILGAESHLHVEIDRETDRTRLAQLQTELASVVDDVRVAVGDWASMRARVLELAGALRTTPPSTADAGDVVEAETYLEWLADDHFTLVAAVSAGADGRSVPGSELGVARRRAMFREGSSVDGDEPFVLAMTKALERSTVHRDVPLDFVGVRRFGPDGAVVGEERFLGLYTANVYSQSVATIPVLRRKAAPVFERSGFAPEGHDGRALAHVLETIPATSSSASR